MNNKKLLGSFLVAAAGCLWGLMSIFVNGLADLGLYAMDVIFVRVVVSSVIMALIILFKDKSLLKVRLRDLWCFFGTGILSLTMFNFCYFSNIRLTSPGVAAVLMYTSPVFILLLSAVLFGEKLSVTKLAACALTFLGCALVGGIFGEGINMAGLALGLLSGIGYGLYSIFGRYASEKGYSSLTITAYTFFFAVFGALPFTNLKNISSVFSAASPLHILTAIGGAVLLTVVPYLLYTAGLKYIETGKAGVIAAIEVVVASLTGYLVFNERFTVSKTAGVLLVLISIAMMNMIKSEKEPKKENGI